MVPEQETGASFEKSAERFRFRLTSHLSQATAHAYYLGVRHQHPSSSAAATSTSAQPEPTPEKESSEQATQSREDDIVVHSSIVFSPASTINISPLDQQEDPPNPSANGDVSPVKQNVAVVVEEQIQEKEIPSAQVVEEEKEDVSDQKIESLGEGGNVATTSVASSTQDTTPVPQPQQLSQSQKKKQNRQQQQQQAAAKEEPAKQEPAKQEPVKQEPVKQVEESTQQEAAAADGGKRAIAPLCLVQSLTLISQTRPIGGECSDRFLAPWQ